jgi:hypothetical protein
MPSSAFVRYNVALLVCSVLLLSVGAAGLWGLHRTGRLPAPPITATNCIDEKFKFLHDADLDDRNLVAVGSSVTWRNLDFATTEGRWPQMRPINAAPCYLKVHETAFLTRFYLDNMPQARVVLSIFAMRDFERCEGTGAFFNTRDAEAYVFEDQEAWHLYFQNFTPLSFVRDALALPSMRSGAATHAPLVMDKYGSGPLEITPPEIRNDVRTTPDCFDHLSAMARELKARGIAWVVVLFPPMPAWIAHYDPGAVRDGAWREAVAERLAGTGTTLIDGRGGPMFEDRHFTDPAHLHWAYTPAFTRWIFGRLDRGGALTATFNGAPNAL